MKNIYNNTASCCTRLLLVISLLFSVNLYAQETMRANLYVMDPSGAVLMDGNLTEYSDTYSNDVDIYDAWKLSNPGANFGILRSGYNLSVERRNVIGSSDSTFFRMWNMSQNNYRIRFVLKNMNHIGLHCIIRDSYLNNEVAIGLNDTTDYDFTVDANPASADQMRFKMYFNVNVSGPVAVNFTSVQAKRKGTDALILWDVANELSIDNYVIERSMNGAEFSEVARQAPSLNAGTLKQYTYTDRTIPKQDIFYRIKAINIGGKIQYSQIVKVSEASFEPGINVYPNPVMGKKLQMQFNDLPSGKYQVTLFSNNGIQQPLKPLLLNDWQTNATILLPENIPAGIYRLQFTCPNGVRIAKTINVQ